MDKWAGEHFKTHWNNADLYLSIKLQQRLQLNLSHCIVSYTGGNLAPYRQTLGNQKGWKEELNALIILTAEKNNT